VNRRRYDLVRADGSVWLDDWIDEDAVSAKAMRRSLRQLADCDAIDICVDSPGGSTREAYGIYTSVRECRKPINVIVVGLAASAASVIAMVGTEIAIVESGQFHLHNSLAASGGRTINGVPHLYGSELRARAAQCARDDAVAHDILCGRSGLPADHIKRLCDAETTLTAPEAIELGFADRIITADELAGRHAARAVANMNEPENRWWAA
jgi:ATP-dependent protease ClpP protease subunit